MSNNTNRYTRLSQESIKNHIIHRYENLLIDTVTIPNETTQACGQLEIKIGNPDPLNRHLFTKEKSPGKQVFIPIFAMEVLALGSITCTGKLEANQMAIFTSISNFKKHKDIPTNTIIHGSVKQLSRKGNFLKYTGTLHSESHDDYASGIMTAFFVEKNTANTDSAAEKKIDQLPDMLDRITISPEHYHKSKHMVVLDNIRHITPSSCIGSYTYAQDHPLTKGHFPSNPIMMGIMQWLGIEDIALFYCQHNKLSESTELYCDALLFKEDLSIVSEIKGITISCLLNTPPHHKQCEITGTKKILFRSMVTPGETIYIQLTAITQ